MRRPIFVALGLAFAAGLGACGSASTAVNTTASTVAASGTTGIAGCSNSEIQGDLYHRGELTMATDNPVYTPWFVSNRPENGKGYESAVAYDVAHALGFTNSEVHWVYEPFNKSYAPGPKAFDFDINEISVTSARAQVVSFSVSYYADNQALVVLKNGPVTKNHSPAALKTYTYGDVIGSTSLAYISSYIKPTTQTRVYNTLNDAKAALDADQIQALVADTPTAQYIAADEIPGSVALGQFPSNGEHFGLLFHKNDPLVACVDKALDLITTQHKLTALSNRWLKIYSSIPTIQP
jgi:polar amino acid transport system substrate-binding protein